MTHHLLRGLPEKPLFIPLFGHYHDQFVAGTKDTEYRKYGQRWNEKTCAVGRVTVLSYGYGRNRRIAGPIVAFEKSTEPSSTSAWIECYGAGICDVACIKVDLFRTWVTEATSASGMLIDRGNFQGSTAQANEHAARLTALWRRKLGDHSIDVALTAHDPVFFS